MARKNELVLGMNGGEVSRNMESRVETQLYKQALSIAENTNLLPEGTAQKRAGTGFVSLSLDSATSFSHIKGFSVSDEFSYQLEFGNRQLRIWRVQDKSIVEVIPSPYTALEARDAQMHRENDVAWFQHPDYPEWQLSRIAVSDLTPSDE